MANLASALKEEISRLARKEIRQQTAGTARTVAQCEREIAALKNRIDGLQRRLSSSGAAPAAAPTATRKAPSGKAATKKKAARTASGSGKASTRARFSAKGLKTHRERLGLSADNYGKLIGVSGLSIYNWEQGKARPRESSIGALSSIKGLGKREAAKRLEETRGIEAEGGGQGQDQDQGEGKGKGEGEGEGNGETGGKGQQQRRGR